MKRLIAVTLAALLLCGCADSSSLTSGEKFESALEEYTEETNPYAFLPDGVRMDDEEHVREIQPDGEGYITFDKLGVKMPYAGKTYIYERSPWDEQVINLCCSAAMFITNEFFPKVNDYVMISYYTDIDPEIISYQRAKEIYPKEMLDILAPDEASYLSKVKKELNELQGFIAAHEIMYDYDYFDLPKDAVFDETSHEDFNIDTKLSQELNFVGISYVSRSNKAIAPETSHTELAAETVELENGYYAIKLTYEQKRYGIDCEKEVYWTYHRGGTRIHRIEFSHDKRSENRMFNAADVLSSIEFTDPTIIAEGGADQNYFGNPMQK